MLKKKNLITILLISILIPILVILGFSLYSRIFFVNINPEIHVEQVKSNKIIQLDILNGCGEDGIANKARLYLKHRGFDVVEIGNFKELVQTSYVISRKGDIESSKMICKAIGIQDSLLQIAIDSSLSLDCSIVIGKDFKKLKPYLSGE